MSLPLNVISASSFLGRNRIRDDSFRAARASQPPPAGPTAGLHSHHFTLFEAITAQVMFRFFALVFRLESVDKGTRLKRISVIPALNILAGIRLAQRRLKFTNSFYKIHLLHLGRHELLLKLHEALSEIENTASYRFLSAKSKQAFSYISRSLCAGDSSREPVKHARNPLRVIWHRQFSTGGLVV